MGESGFFCVLSLVSARNAKRKSANRDEIDRIGTTRHDETDRIGTTRRAETDRIDRIATQAALQIDSTESTETDRIDRIDAPKSTESTESGDPLHPFLSGERY